jgi:hypothetical protein
MTRRIAGRLSAAVAIAALAAGASARAGKHEPIKLPKQEEDEFSGGMANVYFVEPNPRREPGRGKRGGNGKGRKWWNK